MNLEDLKFIQKELHEAYEMNDKILIGYAINRLDTLIFEETQQLQKGNIPNVIRTLPVEIVDFINYFCDVVKNTDVCRDGEIQAEWSNYNKNKDGSGMDDACKWVGEGLKQEVKK